jgi:hypothetical protein
MLKEIDANFEVFDKAWQAEMIKVATELQGDVATYSASYRRLVSLQAWRTHLASRISEESLSFFLEAQNDALTSHVFARLGSWRSALKALRSCIENVCFCLYYKDHPIELTLWRSGQHKPTFNELFIYFEQHPERVKQPSVDAMPLIRKEYPTLSLAVHASAKHFRMTEDIQSTLLWSAAKDRKGKWQTREREVIMALNLLLLALFRKDLTGASLVGLREAIGLAIPPSRYKDIKTHMQVILRQV